MSKKSVKHEKNDDIYARIGLNIRSLRQRLDITIEELANSADVNASFVGHIERGQSKPTLYTLEKITKALNIPIGQLFDLETVKNPIPEKDKIAANVIRILNSKTIAEQNKIIKILKQL
jgi:transcriptional regulator with XRE-family HTH domain